MRIGVVQIVNAQPDMVASLRAGLARLQDAKEAGVDLLVLPELFLGGYYVDQAMVNKIHDQVAHGLDGVPTGSGSSGGGAGGGLSC